MGVFDIFSKRQKRLNKAAPDVYQYDKIPEPLRVQFVHIMNEAIGDFNQINGHPRRVYTTIHNILAREYGLFELEYGSKYEAIVNFFLSTKDHLRALDVIELGMRAIETECQEPYYKDLSQTTLTAPEAIEELNIRFREHGVGYEFVGGEIIRIDSQILHAEVVKPVLLLLQDSIYRGADEEYRNAFQHFRHGRYEEAINECLKAFESTMKAICAKRKWRVDQNATASKLLEVCFANGLV